MDSELINWINCRRRSWTEVGVVDCELINWIDCRREMDQWSERKLNGVVDRELIDWNNCREEVGVGDRELVN